jgi:RNA polymerase sigma-70 factor (ECF subfamily)
VTDVLNPDLPDEIALVWHKRPKGTWREDKVKDDQRGDEELIAAINAGDEAAFEALYDRYRDWVAGLALRFTGDYDLALDVLQETFIYLLEKRPTLRLTARLTTFLYPAVKNLSIAARRKRHRHAPGEEGLGDLPAQEDSADSAREDLAAVFSTLPDAQREVLLMRFADDMQIEEIAEALAVPAGTVKSRLRNGLKALRDDPRTRGYF